MKKSLVALIFFIFALPLILSSCTSEQESFSDAVVLSRHSVTLTSVGDVVNLTARVYLNYREVPEEELEGKIKWTSSDMGVAICDGGVVEVLGYGNCVIRATHESGISATCTVWIPNPNPTLKISETDILLSNIGKKTKITAFTDKDVDITDTVSWISSNNNIVECTDGVVTAVGYGSCTITAISPTDSKMAVCNVTVGDPTAPYVEIKGAKDDKITLNVGEETSLIATVRNGASENIIWKTSDESVATCDAEGNVRAVGNGVCVILAASEDGYTDYVIVTVGKTSNVRYHEQHLKFDFYNVGRELLYIDKNTGQTISRSVVIGYELNDSNLLDDGRLVVQISLLCVKTYDRNGLDGENAGFVTAELYRENNVFCLNHREPSNVDVGEAFSFDFPGFTVQTGENVSQRKFYMTFSTITEE